LRKEENEIEPVARNFGRLCELVEEFEECEKLEEEEEEEMKEMAVEEKERIEGEIEEIETFLIDSLLPPNPEETGKELVLEVRAGTGGSEAQLFAMEMFEMYQKYCQNQNWRFEVSNISSGELAGTCREASAIIKGEDVVKLMRFEGGVHRVQRKPVTDKTRIHTSTVKEFYFLF
jgi:peptide chain release factor 1